MIGEVPQLLKWKKIYRLKKHIIPKTTKPVLKNDSSIFCLENLQKLYRLKKHVIPKTTKPVLKNYSSLSCLENLQKKFVLVPIDKAANNIAFICKSFYMKHILGEVGVSDLPSNT